MKKLPAYIGITGALGMAICDAILLGQPVSGSHYDMSSFGAMEFIASNRAAIGAVGGLICAFFICFGFWYLKTLFEPVNSKLALYLFISLCSMMFFGAAFHAGYFFLSHQLISCYQGIITEAVLNSFRTYLEVLSYLGVPGFLAGTILFFRLAMDARFPFWYRFCNPLVLCALFLGLFMLIPAPIGGYLKPAFINVSLATLFSIRPLS